MEYGYSVVDDNSKVPMLINGINTNATDAYKADILASPEMQGDFDIYVRHFLDFIAMNLSLQKNATAKVSSVTISGVGRGGGHGSERGYDIPSKSNVKAAMGAIKNKYLCGSKWGYVSTTEYKNFSKDRQQDVYHLRQELDGIRRPDARTGTPKDYDNLKLQVSALSKTVDDLLTTYEPSIE